MEPSEVRVLPPGRQRTLLDTALREFACFGFEGASLNRIIRVCQMSKSSFYHYFDSKDALFDAVLTNIGAALVEAVDLPDSHELAGLNFWDRIGLIVDQLSMLSQHDSRFTDLGRLFHLPDAPNGTGTALDHARASINTWLDQALDAGRSAGAVRRDQPAALQTHLTLAVLWAMGDWSIRHLADLNTRQRRELATAHIDAIRRLLAP